MKFLISCIIHFILGHIIVLISTAVLGTTVDMVYFAIIYSTSVLGSWAFLIYDKLNSNSTSPDGPIPSSKMD